MVVIRASRSATSSRRGARRSAGAERVTPRRSSSSRTLGELRAQHLEVEALLRAVVVVPGGDVGPGALGDVADRRAVKAAASEELDGGLEQAIGRGARGRRGHERAIKTFV